MKDSGISMREAMSAGREMGRRGCVGRASRVSVSMLCVVMEVSDGFRFGEEGG